jgi:hypothetical protein
MDFIAALSVEAEPVAGQGLGATVVRFLRPVRFLRRYSGCAYRPAPESRPQFEENDCRHGSQIHMHPEAGAVTVAQC